MLGKVVQFYSRHQRCQDKSSYEYYEELISNGPAQKDNKKKDTIELLCKILFVEHCSILGIEFFQLVLPYRYPYPHSWKHPNVMQCNEAESKAIRPPLHYVLSCISIDKPLPFCSIMIGNGFWMAVSLKQQRLITAHCISKSTVGRSVGREKIGGRHTIGIGAFAYRTAILLQNTAQQNTAKLKNILSMHWIISAGRMYMLCQGSSGGDWLTREVPPIAAEVDDAFKKKSSNHHGLTVRKHRL